MDTRTNCSFLEDEMMQSAICKRARKSFSRVHLAAAIFLIAANAAMLISELVLILTVGVEKTLGLLENPYVIWGLQVLCMYVIAFPIFLLIVRKLPRRKREKESMSLKEFGALFLICEAIMIGFSILSNLLTEYLSGVLGYPIENTTSDMISESPIWLVILVAVIIGPIVEELVFRKTFIDVLGTYGDRVAIVFSSLAFGLFHGNFSQMFYAIGIGLVLGYVYTKTSKIKHTIFLHIALNFIGTVPVLLVYDRAERLMNLPEDYIPAESEAVSILIDTALVGLVSLMQYALAVAGLILLIRLTIQRAYKVPKTCDIPIPKWHFLTTTVFNFGFLFFLIVCAAQFALSLLPPEFLNA